jgi:hypothetical protein
VEANESWRNRLPSDRCRLFPSKADSRFAFEVIPEHFRGPRPLATHHATSLNLPPFYGCVPPRVVTLLKVSEIISSPFPEWHSVREKFGFAAAA